MLTIGEKTIQNHSPLELIKYGIALCPEDRKAAGIVDDLTVRKNIILAVQANKGWLNISEFAEAI